jgi:hypothetical protein
MNLTVPNGIQKGNPITAAFLSDLCRAVKAITPQSSADILVSTTSGGTTFRQTNRFGGTQSQPILYGTAAADYSSGTTISLTSCDANGVADGVGSVTVTIPTSWGTVNLLSATVGGVDAVTVTCKIASGTLLQYAYAANGTPYLLGLPPTVVEFLRYDNSTYKLQQRVRWLFGTNVSTLSDWIDFATSEESDTTPCS